MCCVLHSLPNVGCQYYLEILVYSMVVWMDPCGKYTWVSNEVAKLNSSVVTAVKV